MTNLYPYSSLRQFFSEIYHILREADKNVTEIWCEIPKIKSIINLSKFELLEFLEKFEFISIKKGNYIQYIVINKVLFIIDCINLLQFDIKDLSEILDYNGFEILVKEILSRNNYHSITNFRFSDRFGRKSGKAKKRYEIDVIGIFSKYILIIDAKQWKRRDTYNVLNKAATKQYHRILALKQNPIVFTKLFIKILGKLPNLLHQSHYILIPLMVTLEDNIIKLNDIQVPLVSIYELNAFLLELPKNLHYFKTIQIENKELFI
ncbi:MAG: NERD domain-containing protein [Candidatus Thorarchaeota archaeon]